MEKKYVGIGIAALAAGTGAAVYKKKKIQNQKKEVQEHTRYEAYRNTERGKQVRNAKGIYYSRGNYEAFARPEKPEGIEEKSAYIVGRRSCSSGCSLLFGKRWPDAWRTDSYSGSHGYCRRSL